MTREYLILFIIILISSCSSKKQLIYLNDTPTQNFIKSKNNLEYKINKGDILKIDIYTVVPEASQPYNNFQNNNLTNSELLPLEGYTVDSDFKINFPILGGINVENLTEATLAKKIRSLLISEGHLEDPHVIVKLVNSKFTVLGEVSKPGTYVHFNKNLNIFQALGYAGDLLITAKRKNITLIREENGLKKTFKLSLTKGELLNKPYYYIKNNDVIIVEPNFNKIKSAGFIGSPESIASIASLLLSITLLIINN